MSALTDSKFSLTAVSAGRITFSYDGAVPEDQDPNTPSARFDKVELSYPAGAANLTAVDFFGIPFTLETLDSNQNVLQRLTYYTSTKTLVAALLVLVPNAEITTNGKTGAHFARLLAGQAAGRLSQHAALCEFGRRPEPDDRRHLCGTGGAEPQHLRLHGNLGQRRHDHAHRHDRPAA